MVKGKLIGQGRTAEVFMWGEKHILKLYRKDVLNELIENEFKISRMAFEKKIATPYAQDIVEIEEKKGIVFELVNGGTMMKFISLKPWYTKQKAHNLANLHYLIHKTKVVGIVDQKVMLKESINATDLLTEDKKKNIVEYLELLESGSYLCHGDFHPDNIIMSKDKEIVIDWMTGVMGNPLADVARSCILLSISSLPENITFMMKNMINFFRKRFYYDYIKQYLKISDTKMEEVERWMLPVAAARLIEWLPQSEKEQLLRIVDEELHKFAMV